MLLDRDLWEAWSQHPPRFGNFTFVLLPWHHIVELHGFRRHAPGLNYAPLRDAAALFSKLNPAYPHVVVLSQADRRQILVMERRAGGRDRAPGPHAGVPQRGDAALRRVK